MRQVLVAVLLCLSCCVCYPQSANPYDPPFLCSTDSSGGSALTDIVGTRHILWIMCAGDSNSLPDWPVHPGNCDTGQTRVMYPTTYRMPSWASIMFDSNRVESLTSYYIDQSDGNFRVVGSIAGQNDSTIFVCDPDTAVRPRRCTNDGPYNGGNTFFQNIMQKVDVAIDFADYLDNESDAWVPFLIFEIYGHCEEGRCEGGGQKPIGLSYTSDDTNSIGNFIQVGGSNGNAFWSSAEQAYAGYPDSVSAAYWENMNIMAHEYGHALGLSHTYCDNCPGEAPNTDYANVGCGSFDPMGYPHFRDSDNNNAFGGLSPYNPIYRIGAGWMTPITVDAPLTDYTLDDHLLNDVCLKIPAYRATSNDQYFVASTVTRNTPWDRLWPTDGIMIYHYNPLGVQSHHSHKKIDSELSSGLYDWDILHEYSNPDWLCGYPDTCLLWTGDNTFDTNSVTGLDSFDFVWAHNPFGDWPTRMYYGPNDEVHGTGSAGNFFVTGNMFNDTTNPSSAAQRSTSPWAQDLPTMVSIRVLGVDSLSGTCTVNAWSRHWSGTLDMSATWWDSVVVDANLTVPSGFTLTILPGTKIVADSGVTITISGSLHGDGEEGDSIRFMAAPGVTEWGGIYIGQYGYCDMSYAVIEDAPIAFFSENAGVSDIAMQLTDTRIQGGSLRIWGSSTRTHVIERVTIQDIPAASLISGFYFLNTKIYAEHFWVLNCGYRTGTFKNTTGTLVGAYFNGQTSNQGLFFYGSTNGLVFKCCTIDHVAPNNSSPGAAIWCLGGANPIFGATGTPAYNNYITDDELCLVRFEGSAGRPWLSGYNNILVQANLLGNGRFFKWDSPGGSLPYEAKYIYWGGVTPVIGYFDPSDSRYWNFNAYLSTDPSMCIGAGDSYALESAFDSALALEQAEQYADAQAAYLAIAENTDYVIGDRTMAAARAVMVDRETQELSVTEVDELSSMLEESAENLTDTLGIERVKLCHLTDEASFASALDGYEDLLERELTFEDSLLTVIDIYHVQMLAGSGGGHLDAAIEPRNANLAIHSDAEGIRRVDEAMAILMGRYETDKVETLLPTTYALYQNYPNPFNPVTEIRFDLPENANVELKIFNTLGQEVTTLINEARSAGAHRVQWDASNAASGVYLYQIKAGSFSDSKKMVLIR